MLTSNQQAPAFILKDQAGEERSLKQYQGTWVLLYFYPKDDTPGCTKEACTIAEIYSDFKKRTVTVLGVSNDTVKSHATFAKKYRLPFTLLSDPTMEMMDAYGAKVEKMMYGKPVRGTARISYLINSEGIIAKAYPHVDPANHALELLADLQLVQQAATQ